VNSVSMHDVAALAGVSQATVSNAINRPHMVRAATIERVQAAMDELGFVRNDAARQLKIGRSTSLGLLLVDLANPFFTELARAVEGRADAHGYSVLLGDSNESETREASYFDLFEEQRVEGLLIAPVGAIAQRLERLRKRGTPAVLLGHQPGFSDFSSVALDDVAGGRLAVGHLLDIGRRRVAFVGGPLTLPQMADRVRGARRAAEEAGQTLRVIETVARSFEEGERVGADLLAQGRADLPDAIFAANDVVALGILKALHVDGGLRVPEDIAVIGYDDVALARHSLLPLASVRQPSARIGETALDLLLAEIDDPGGAETSHVLFTPELVIRDSAAA